MVMGLFALAIINRFVEKMPLANSLTLTALLGYVPSKPSCLKRVSYWLIGLSLALLIGESYSFMVGRDFIMAYPSFITRLATAIIFTLTNGQLLLWLASLGVLAAPFLISSNVNVAEKSLT
jgi:hypothetical protein